MAHTTLLPYSTHSTSRTPRRRHWRRHPPTLITKTSSSSSSSAPSPVNISTLPDLVHDCHQRLLTTTTDEQLKLTCKQIAHSLRMVADQVDEKYCQDLTFHHYLSYLSIRFIFQTSNLRTIFYTLWTRSFLPLVFVMCKTKIFF